MRADFLQLRLSLALPILLVGLCVLSSVRKSHETFLTQPASQESTSVPDPAGSESSERQPARPTLLCLEPGVTLVQSGLPGLSMPCIFGGLPATAAADRPSLSGHVSSRRVWIFSSGNIPFIPRGPPCFFSGLSAVS